MRVFHILCASLLWQKQTKVSLNAKYVHNTWQDLFWSSCITHQKLVRPSDFVGKYIVSGVVFIAKAGKTRVLFAHYLSVTNYLSVTSALAPIFIFALFVLRCWVTLGGDVSPQQVHAERTGTQRCCLWFAAAARSTPSIEGKMHIFAGGVEPKLGPGPD